MTTATQIERPSTVYAEFWPANVLLPSGEIRRKCRVYLTDVGLIIFFTRPTDELSPGFHAQIDFDSMVPPNIHAHNVGVDVAVFGFVADENGGDMTTEMVVITPTGGCGCGNTLKTWKPSWATSVTPWPSA